MRVKVQLLLLLILILSACATTQNSIDSKQPQGLEIPTQSTKEPANPAPSPLPSENVKSDSSEKIYERKGYDIVFSKPDKIAKWVAYHLTAEHLKSHKVKRTNNFHIDSEIEGSATPDDYKKTGYDRGHLAPAGDMEWSEDAMSESFLMTNMTPQLPRLNRGIWKRLEDAEREWALKDNDVYVITGPVLSASSKKIGNGVSVPEKFFKVFFEVHDGKPRAIAFIIPQDFKDSNLCSYSMSLLEAEEITGIKFFPEKISKKDVENAADCNGWMNLIYRKASRSSAGSESLTCPTGAKLLQAEIRGCCSGHHGVAGPKSHHACCGDDGKVICNDGTKSPSCKCSQK